MEKIRFSHTVKGFLRLNSSADIQMRRRFKETLEDKVNELVGSETRQWDTSIPAMLRREIELTREQLEDIKFLTREQMISLLRQECSIGTDMKNLRQSRPWYIPVSFNEECKLKQRLFDIEKDRRNLKMKLEEKTRCLEDKLLSLLNKHQQLDI